MDNAQCRQEKQCQDLQAENCLVQLKYIRARVAGLDRELSQYMQAFDTSNRNYALKYCSFVLVQLEMSAVTENFCSSDISNVHFLCNFLREVSF